MIKIEVTVEADAFRDQADAHVADDIMPALVDALNDVAKAAVVGIVGAIDANLDRPSPYTRAAPAMLPARLGGKRDPAALVFLRDDQAEYLDLIVNTGTARSIDAGHRAQRTRRARVRLETESMSTTPPPSSPPPSFELLTFKVELLTQKFDEFTKEIKTTYASKTEIADLRDDVVGIKGNITWLLRLVLGLVVAAVVGLVIMKGGVPR